MKYEIMTTFALRQSIKDDKSIFYQRLLRICETLQNWEGEQDTEIGMNWY